MSDGGPRLCFSALVEAGNGEMLEVQLESLMS